MRGKDRKLGSVVTSQCVKKAQSEWRPETRPGRKGKLGVRSMVKIGIGVGIQRIMLCGRQDEE